MKEGSEGEDRGNEIKSQAEGLQDGEERREVNAEGEQEIPKGGPTEDKIHVSKLQFGNCSRWGH